MYQLRINILWAFRKITDMFSQIINILGEVVEIFFKHGFLLFLASVLVNLRVSKLGLDIKDLLKILAVVVQHFKVSSFDVLIL